MSTRSSLAWALGDLSAGHRAIARTETDRSSNALAARVGDLSSVREAARFAFEASRRFLSQVGWAGPVPDPAEALDLDDPALLEALAGDPGPEDLAARCLARFGRFYILHHPRLSSIARPGCPELARRALARLGHTLAEAGSDPSIESQRLIEPAERSSALGAALAAWAARSAAAGALDAEHGNDLDEALLATLPSLGPDSPVPGAARLDEALAVLEAALQSGSSADALERDRAAVLRALADCPEVPPHLLVRTRVAEAAILLVEGRLEAARDRLSGLAGAVGLEELDRAAELFADRGGRGYAPPESHEAAPAGLAFEALLLRMAESAVDPGPEFGRAFAPGTQHRAVVEEFDLDDLLVTLRGPTGLVARGRLEPSGWRWPDPRRERRPAVRVGDSIIVEVAAAPGGDREAAVLAVDPWERFLPEFFRRNQDRVLQARTTSVEPERLVVSIIDRLVGEPEGIQGELPLEEMDLESPFPLELYFQPGDVLPVLIDEIDAEDGWLRFVSPWIDRDPWDDGYIARKFRPGVVYRGTVVRLEREWVGVMLEPGVVARMPLPARGSYALIVPIEVVVTAVDEPNRILHVQRKVQT